MNSVSALQEVRAKRRDGDGFGLHVLQCVIHQVQIFRISENQQVEVAAKLGRPVEYARLAAHAERSRATRSDRRKGFEYRAPGQASLPAPDMSPTASSTPGSAAEE